MKHIKNILQYLFQKRHDGIYSLYNIYISLLKTQQILTINFKLPIVEIHCQQGETPTLSPKYPFDLEAYRQFDNNIWCYWYYISVSTNELDFVANINNANETDINQHFNNINGLENIRDNSSAANLEINFEPIEDYLDDEITTTLALSQKKYWWPALCRIMHSHMNSLENDFNKYLQGWAEMLKNEKNAELDEETEEQSNTLIGDVTHPANDISAKWNLLTLFNNINVNLPF
ncbi:hypothetical protein RhiirA1_474476 [Rhizophagus irregularis]|uniref:Uncharacterized protein n=1 Tax=Rhizophagus irregularis TaxID=588596 RepID=A0A2N0QYG8_9GLOM|nr:hypothetical protein RhiirA1_474476 [Rhizophagus irregularis]